MRRFVTTTKEIARHLITRTGAHTALDALRRARGRDSDYLSSASRAERFAKIYSMATWQRWGRGAPNSGTGSSLVATAAIRRELPELLAKIECQVLLDIGCGDFTWMQAIDLQQHYIGIDIVPEVIACNNQLYGTKG